MRLYSLSSNKSWPYLFGFFWDYIKIEYREQIKNLMQLGEKISTGITTATPEMLYKIWREIKYRFDICIATNNGAHVKTYTNKILYFYLPSNSDRLFISNVFHVALVQNPAYFWNNLYKIYSLL